MGGYVGGSRSELASVEYNVGHLTSFSRIIEILELTAVAAITIDIAPTYSSRRVDGPCCVAFGIVRDGDGLLIAFIGPGQGYFVAVDRSDQTYRSIAVATKGGEGEASCPAVAVVSGGIVNREFVSCLNGIICGDLETVVDDSGTSLGCHRTIGCGSSVNGQHRVVAGNRDVRVASGCGFPVVYHRQRQVRGFSVNHVLRSIVL